MKVADPQLRGALRHVTGVFAARRREGIATLPGWEDARERARRIKADVLSHLDSYLEAFEANAQRMGAQVHWARDAAEACALVARIAQDHGVRTVVKSKSMVTEEIHLNAALAAHGIESIETDLGEYIIQIAGETPSHIVAPAIHKTKGQVAELFADKLGIEVTTDEALLTGAARAVLRDRFARADMGVSGVNLAVAETGSIVIIENEGNARLTTSLPRVHVALMGIEKLIPRFADIELFLQLLPRSGTGQMMTAYGSILTGPHPAEGPTELHIVILDNGRSRMLAHPVTRQALACIRCGACLNACPVYAQTGGHEYDSVYSGPIGAVISPQLFGLQQYAHLPFASSLCGACRDVCPVKIDIPGLLLHLRARVAERRPGLERLGFAVYGFVARRPRLFRLAGRIARQLPLRLLRPFSIWQRDRELPAPAPRSFHELWKARS